MRKRKAQLPLMKSDRAFFQQFYEEYKLFMHYTAKKYVSDPADCDDLVQDAIVRLINNISTLKEINRCKTVKYIVLTIRTAYLDSEKFRQKGKLFFLDDQTLEALMIEHLLPQDIDHRLHASMAVAKLKQELPERDWVILEGKHLLGLSQEELSRLVGVSPDSVRMVLHRAKEKAKSILSGDAIEGGDYYG